METSETCKCRAGDKDPQDKADGYPTLDNYDKTQFEIEGTVLNKYMGSGPEVLIPQYSYSGRREGDRVWFIRRLFFADAHRAAGSGHDHSPMGFCRLPAACEDHHSKSRCSY